MKGRLIGKRSLPRIIPRLRVERFFFRNGQLREELSIRSKAFHGPHRTWHRNGQLASEEHFQAGVLHGVVRQWSERGKLLGSFRMKHGTGMVRHWFDDGRLQMEYTLVNGKFTGRSRAWLRDGTLSLEHFGIENCTVTETEYRAAAKQPEYPRLPARRRTKPLPTREEIDRRELKLHVERLLRRKDQCEARQWLQSGASKRSLGLLNFKQASQLVECLYSAEARTVLIVEIYEGKAGKQFSDALLVQMPEKKRLRLLIRQCLTKLPKKLRAGVLPDPDEGQEYLFAMFG